MLEVRELQTAYGRSQVLFGVALEIGKSEVVSLLGRNGMGKTTTVRSIMGIVSPSSGTIRFAGRELHRLPPYRIAKAGLGLVPEGRQVFPNLTVRENLVATAAKGPWTLQRVYGLFGNLKEREHHYGNQLSGGEQQMLAIGRALMTNPKLLILDEATEGLAPLIIRQIADIIGNLKRAGMTMLLVEQNLALATELADHVVVLGKGRVRWAGTSEELRSADKVRQTWLGV